MKILFVTNEIPFPPDNGVRIVSHNAMRLMHESGHELALAVLSEETDNLDGRFHEIKKYCQVGCAWRMPLPARNRMMLMLTAILANRLIPVERYRCASFRKKLAQTIEGFKPDVVHFDIITMAQYRDTVPLGVGVVASINDSYTLTLVDLLSAGQYTGFHFIYRKLQLYQARRYEINEYIKFDKIHVMTEVDAAYLKNLNSDIQVSVIPNGVNPSLFEVYATTIDKTDIIFVAKLVGENLYSLQEFLKISWPIVIDRFPDVMFRIVGRLDSDAKLLKERLKNVQGVIFTGYVENLENEYEKCGIAIVPINKSCGIVNKVIEAMVSGLAVVGFQKTFAGLNGAKKDVHYISVNDYQSMGYAVVDLLQDSLRCKAIKNEAHTFAADNYSWRSRRKLYEKMYKCAANHAYEAYREKNDSII